VNGGVVAVSVLTDNPSYSFEDAQAIEFHSVVSPFKAKIQALLASPYEETLFLDTDTRIRQPISPLWEVLQTADLALAHAPDIARDEHGKALYLKNHRVDTEFNTGVILFRKTPEVVAVFEAWLQAMEAQPDDSIRAGVNCDQTYFNRVISPQLLADRPPVRFSALDNRVYNVRKPHYRFLTPEEQQRVCIEHWRNVYTPEQQAAGLGNPPAPAARLVPPSLWHRVVRWFSV
jgi:hypothetical protein